MGLRAGRLFYLMGASGVGKDALIAAVRQRCLSHVHVACRYTTRPPAQPSPLEIGLSAAVFERHAAAGRFWLIWHGHGVRYAIRGRECARLDAGQDLIVNGSRRYLDCARAEYPALVPVLVRCCDESVLRQRLMARGRETPAEIDARIVRGRRFNEAPPDARVIDNAGRLDTAVARFVSILCAG